MAQAIAKRSEIPAEKRWATEDLYVSDAVWEADLAEVTALVDEAAKYQGHLGDSAQMLLEFLNFEDGLSVSFSIVWLSPFSWRACSFWRMRACLLFWLSPCAG